MRLTNKQIADRIYLHYFGHLDDKNYKAEKTQEIVDWLDSGESTTLRNALAEWGEYDKDEIELQALPPRPKRGRKVKEQRT